MKHGGSSRPMNWSGPAASSAAWSRKVSTGAPARSSASNRKPLATGSICARANRRNRSPRSTTAEEFAAGQTGLSIFSAGHKRQPLEQVYILFVLQQCAVQRRDELLGIALAQSLGPDVLGHQQFQPIQKLGCRGLFFHARHITNFIE